MQYRKFGKLNIEVSALGFGAMRLPTTDGKAMTKNIDEKEAIHMIRTAIDKGINYIDTAYPYHSGESETVVGKALKDGYRKKVYLATKSPTWLITCPEDFDKYLDEQLAKLQTEYIDFYLLHTLDAKSWKNTILKHRILERAEAAKAAGKIKHLGFSFHDGIGAFKEIVDGYDKWEFCQIQYNYMDINQQAGTEGLKYAASKGLAVIVMEPLLGGKLASPPAPVNELFNSSLNTRTPADWSLQWIWDQEEVSLILSGMSTMEQVNQNIESALVSGAGSMSKEDRKIIQMVRSRFNELLKIPCTKCHYCMPCPNGINIPGNFEIYNDAFVYGDIKAAKDSYVRLKNMDGEKAIAGSCVSCGICEQMCPQKIEISALMPEVHTFLSK